MKVPKLPNVTSLDDFELGRILGTGSFGRVLHCKHKATGMHVAIKILSKAQILKTFINIRTARRQRRPDIAGRLLYALVSGIFILTNT